MDLRVIRTFIVIVLSGLLGSFSLTFLVTDPGAPVFYSVNGLVIGVPAGVLAARMHNPIRVAVISFFIALATAALVTLLVAPLFTGSAS